MSAKLIHRLGSLSKLAEIPHSELTWLVKYGHYGRYDVGTVIGPKGKRIDHLWIILSGKVAIRVDRGVGPRLVTEWRNGDVTGMLPYSRMSSPPGDNYIEEKAELISIHVKLFPEMIQTCPKFTAYTIHSMIDRARNFNTSDLEDEKMISLGKLSAGLAHELINPSSVTVRNANLMLESLIKLDMASRQIGAAGLTDSQLNKLDAIRDSCLNDCNDKPVSPIQKADHQDKITDWLERHNFDTKYGVALEDASLTVENLQELADNVPRKALEAAINWLTATMLNHMLTKEIKHASTRIHQVIEAVKKFTYMDNLGEKEYVDAEFGIRNTLSVLIAKIQAKNASVTFDIKRKIPSVYAKGADINQVWFNLLDNAIDAVSHSGKIQIDASSELDRVVVRIIDDGPGIAAENIPKIFDPFFTTKPPGQNTGLGLDIARRLVRRYHGDITVHSQPGRTEFCVSLLTQKNGKANKQ